MAEEAPPQAEVEAVQTVQRKITIKRTRNLNQRKKNQLPNSFYYILIFIAVQVGLSSAWQWFPAGFLSLSEVGETAGILDNIPYALIIFLLIPYSSTIFKLAALVWLTLVIGDGLLRLIMLYTYYSGGEIESWAISNLLVAVSWLYLLIPLLWLGWVRKNFLARPTARYSPLNTYLLFVRPKNVQDIFISLTGAPTSHVSVVHKGQHYFFKRGLKGYRKQLVRFSVLKQGRLVKIDPPPDFGKMLDIKLGSEYKLIANNCCTVLRGTGIEVGRLDFFPAVFMMRYL